MVVHRLWCRYRGRMREAEGLVVLTTLDIVIPDSVLRGLSSWDMTFSGEDVRGSGWAVCDVLEVLAGRVNRFFR